MWLCNMNSFPVGRIGTLRYHRAFRNRAATLFNCLPPNIRTISNCGSVANSKRALDYHLCSIVDSPIMPNDCNHLNTWANEHIYNERGGQKTPTKLTKKIG